MDRFKDHESPDLETPAAEEAVVETPSPVAGLQRRMGNAALLQMRAVQRRSALQKRDVFEEARADQMARREAAVAEQADQVTAAIPSGGEALHPQVRAVAEQQHGVSMADVRVVNNADAATDPIQAKAFTTTDSGTPKVVMGSMDMQSQDAQFTLMHELSHVAQQKKGMTGGLDGLGGDAGTRESLENHADEHAAEMLKHTH
jgi:hypothetical protein